MAETDAKCQLYRENLDRQCHQMNLSTVINGLKNGREHLRGMSATGLAQGLL